MLNAFPLLPWHRWPFVNSWYWQARPVFPSQHTSMLYWVYPPPRPVLAGLIYCIPIHRHLIQVAIVGQRSSQSTPLFSRRHRLFVPMKGRRSAQKRAEKECETDRHGGVVLQSSPGPQVTHNGRSEIFLKSENCSVALRTRRTAAIRVPSAR